MELELMYRQSAQDLDEIDGNRGAATMEASVDRIGTIPLFELLAPPLRKQIEGIGELVTAEQDDLLSRQGAMPGFLHILLEGQVALTSAMADGITAVVSVVHPGAHFVLSSVLAELPYLMTARAVMRSRVLAIDAPSLLRLVEHERSLANALLHSVSHEFRGMVQQVRDLKLRTAAQRLGCYLLERVKDSNARKADFRLPFEKGLLAAQIGCRQENLSRAFAALREHGVETHGLRVILHDIPRLKAVAMPDDVSDAEAAQDRSSSPRIG
ncbi:MAG TPA: cyclic nucleotide-binding domain-containing protein [Acetobacteraceae bacterium]|nr:cyclic nucleotide-binding domain-containing protein [Acetobacteraceae bacterium]